MVLFVALVVAALLADDLVRAVEDAGSSARRLRRGARRGAPGRGRVRS